MDNQKLHSTAPEDIPLPIVKEGQKSGVTKSKIYIPQPNLTYNFSQNLHVDIKNQKLKGLEFYRRPGE